MGTTDSEAIDRADMQRLMAGHDASLNDLMDRHGEPVFRFLVRLLGNEDDAQDLAQETFVRVYDSHNRFRPEFKFTTWMYTIAANLARNHFRWRARHPAISLEASHPETVQTVTDEMCSSIDIPSESAQLAERAAAVRAAVGRLPDDQREALVLCEWQEFSMIEAAAILETTPKAVESRLYRARKALRQALQAWMKEDAVS